MKRIVCPDCGMSTWDEEFGCRLPGCENYGVIANAESYKEVPLAYGNVAPLHD